MTTTYKFKAAYTSSGEGYAPTPAPTITIVDTSNNVLVNAAATTALSNLTGVYIYSYSGADDLDLVAKFDTTDANVDDKELFSYTPDILTSKLDGKISAIPAAVWASATRTLTSFGTLAADVWAYVSRTLTQTATQVASALSGSTITITNRVTFEATITGLTIPATWTAIYFTAKDNTNYPDSMSVLQIKESNPADGNDGITYVGRTAADGTTRAYGSLDVDQAGGEITITVADNLDLSGVATSATYDIKCLKSDGTSVLLVEGGALRIQSTPTLTV